MDEHLDGLAALLTKLLKEPAIVKTDVPGLTLYRRDSPEVIDFEAGQIMVSLIVQGQKVTSICGQHLCYGRGQCLFCGMAAPALFHSLDASPQKPFLAVSLTLSQEQLASACFEIGALQVKEASGSESGIFVFDADEALIDAFYRLIKTLGCISEQEHIAPLIIEEIYYRLFLSECGAGLYSIALQGTLCSSIMRAINLMKQHYSENLSISNIAERVNMSVSSFYRHFKSVTGVSPLQFQKQIRLHEAKLLVAAQKFGVAEIAYEVGYESPSQFIRDYRRCFGQTPGRELKNQAAKGS